MFSSFFFQSHLLLGLWRKNKAVYIFERLHGCTKAAQSVKLRVFPLKTAPAILTPIDLMPNLASRADGWRDGRVAEGGGLLNRYTVKSRIGGSNPPLSAT